MTSKTLTGISFVLAAVQPARATETENQGLRAIPPILNPFMQQRRFNVLLLAIGGLCLASVNRMAVAETVTTAPQWQEVELTFTATRDAANPYTDTEAWADFTHEDGTKIRRPMFWDGGRAFRLRFASTKLSGTWRWARVDHRRDCLH